MPQWREFRSRKAGYTYRFEIGVAFNTQVNYLIYRFEKFARYRDFKAMQKAIPQLERSKLIKHSSKYEWHENYAFVL